VNQALAQRIEAVHRQSRGCYGSPRVHEALRHKRVACSRKQVAKLMRGQGLKARVSEVYVANPKLHAFFRKTANVRLDKPAPVAVNQVWVGDVTYIRLGRAFVYLAVVMDLYSRRIVGWALSRRKSVRVTLQALRRAIDSRRPQAGLIFHSDRGVEYAAFRYQDELSQYGIVASMNRPGHCQDNGHMVSFFHSLKAELVRGSHIGSLSTLRRRLGTYIARFYNPVRLHSALGYRSPMQFERLTTHGKRLANAVN
jgi:transposase InsO family protein